MRFKKLRDVKSPTKAYSGDAGIDIYSPSSVHINPGQTIQVKLGIAIEIERNQVAIMSERSGMAIKYGITSIGNIIDSGYRGEISIMLFNSSTNSVSFNTGDKIGQIVICQLGLESSFVQEVYELSESERGEKAHYSSGK